MFKKILIANRGEIACRVIKTARKMGIATVAVHSDADAQALHVRMADEAVAIGPAPAGQSYIAIDRILGAIRQTGAEAVHPGYGFLSENPKFAKALAEEGVAFIGPPVGAIEAMGDKITSKKIAAEAGVSTVPGYMGLIGDADEAVRIAGEIGYPVMIKASAGGGGKGMRIAWTATPRRARGFSRRRARRPPALATTASSSRSSSPSRGISKSRSWPTATATRSIWVSANARSSAATRRSSKRRPRRSSTTRPAARWASRPSPWPARSAMPVPAPWSSSSMPSGDFYFLEMNTRLQVEHPVTELVTGIDLVEQMIRVAAGEPLPFAQDDIRLDGWAIESRLYAEDPYRNFLPSIGRLTRYRPPAEQAAGPMLAAGDWHGAAPEAARSRSATTPGSSRAARSRCSTTR